MWTSVPHMPQVSTFNKTSPGPGTGSGASSTVNSFPPRPGCDLHDLYAPSFIGFVDRRILCLFACIALTVASLNVSMAERMSITGEDLKWSPSKNRRQDMKS